MNYDLHTSSIWMKKSTLNNVIPNYLDRKNEKLWSEML